MRRWFTIVAFLIALVCLLSCQSRSKEVLYLFNWTDYIEQSLIKRFERENNCRVVLDTYNSNETMHAKLLTSKSAFDIIIPSGDYIALLLEDDLLDELDFSLLPNMRNLNPDILNKIKEYEFKGGYTVPYFWGTSGIIYNRKYISDAEMADISWDIFSESKYENKFTLLDDIREVIGAALIANGYQPNEFTATSLATARQTLLRWDKNVLQYDSDSFKNEIQDGTIWLGHAYNGDALQVMEENDEVGFVLPREGSTLWIDFFAIPRNAESKELAHKFINFFLEENNALKNAEYVQYATPNLAAYDKLDEVTRSNENIYPTDEYLNRSYLLKHIRDEILKLDIIWQEIRNN